MIKVFLSDDTQPIIEHLVEPNRMALFSETWCRQNSTPNPNKRLFNKCLMFADHYLTLEPKTRKIYDDIASVYGNKFKGQQQIKAWCDEFVADINDAADIINFVHLAEASGNSTLHMIACGIIINDIANMSIEDFQKKYKIRSDFTEAEIKIMQEENEIWSKTSLNLVAEQPAEDTDDL